MCKRQGNIYLSEKAFEKGLWLALLNAERKSKLIKQHPEWLLKDSKGNGEELIIIQAGSAGFMPSIYIIYNLGNSLMRYSILGQF